MGHHPDLYPANANSIAHVMVSTLACSQQKSVMQGHPDFNYQAGDIVLRLDLDEASGDSGLMDTVGEVVDGDNGLLKIRLASGATVWLAPDRVSSLEIQCCNGNYCSKPSIQGRPPLLASLFWGLMVVYPKAFS